MEKNHRESERRLALWENLATLSNFASVLPTNSFLTVVLQHLSRFFRADYGALVLIEDGTKNNYAYYTIEYEQQPVITEALKEIIESEKNSPNSRITIINKWSEESQFSRLNSALENTKIASALYLSLVHNGRLKTILWLWSKKPRHFSDNDSKLLETVFSPIIDLFDCNCIATDLRRERQEFSNILEVIPLGIIETDKNEKIKFLNQAAEKILGVDRTMLLQQSLKEILPENTGVIRYLRHNQARILELSRIDVSDERKIITIQDETEKINSQKHISRTIRKLSEMHQKPLQGIIADISSLALNGTTTENKYNIINRANQQCQELLLCCNLFSRILRWELAGENIYEDLRENSSRENVATLFLKVLQNHPLRQTPNVTIGHPVQLETNINPRMWELFFLSLLEQIKPIANQQPVTVKFSQTNNHLEITIESIQEIPEFIKESEELTAQFLNKFLTALTGTIVRQSNSLVIRLPVNLQLD